MQHPRTEEPKKARPPHSAAAFDPVDTKQKPWPILAQAVPYGAASYLASMCVTIAIFYRVYDGETSRSGRGLLLYLYVVDEHAAAAGASCVVHPMPMHSLCACKARPKWAACVTYQG